MGNEGKRSECQIVFVPLPKCKQFQDVEDTCIPHLMGVWCKTQIMLNLNTNVMKERSKLLKALKTLIEASSSASCNQIVVTSDNDEEGNLHRIRVVQSNRSMAFMSTQIIGFVHHPLSCYVDYNAELEQCELNIF